MTTDALTGETLTRLTTRIREDARVGRLQLPSLPDVAIRIRRALEDERKNSHQVARIVQFDPVLSARLLQIANSAHHRSHRKVGDVREAIARLGLVATRNLATALSLHHTFTCSDPRLREYVTEQWKESCRVAAVASVLAAVTPGMKPDLAALGGLLHNIGTLPLLPYLREQPALVSRRRILDAALGRLRARLGSTLLRHWQFDDALVSVPAEADNWLRDSGGDTPDYVDVVLVARAHVGFGHDHAGGHLAAMPAFRKFPISRLGPDASIQLLEEAREEITLMMQLLAGKG